MNIAYLGPKDSFSHIAALKFQGAGDKLTEFPTITRALLGIGGECEAAVVPFENSSEGGVSDTLDALIAGEGLFINYEYGLKIEHRLLTYQGAGLNEIKTVVTHRQAYGQCRETIARILPGAEIVFADSTSAAAKAVKDKSTAAIGGVRLAAGGLEASDFTVNDQKDNRTRFIFVSGRNTPDPRNDKTTVVFESENKPGGLMKLLKIFEEHNINMTRIESRPRKDIMDRYLFIVNITGGVLDRNISHALKRIRERTVYYKFLGCYKEV